MTKLLPFAWPTVSVSKHKSAFYISANKLFKLYCITAKHDPPYTLLLLTDETHKVRMHSLSSGEFDDFFFNVIFWKPAQVG